MPLFNDLSIRFRSIKISFRSSCCNRERSHSSSSLSTKSNHKVSETPKDIHSTTSSPEASD